MLHVPEEEKPLLEKRKSSKSEKEALEKKEKELDKLIETPPINPLAVQAEKAVKNHGKSAKSMPTIIDRSEIPCMLIFYLTLCWGLGHYGYSVLWFIPALLSMVFLYQRRVKRFAELELFYLRREADKRSVPTHDESAEWINYIVGRVWGVYEPVLCATVLEVVNEALEDACPSFLNALKLTTFTLGSEPPLILGFTRYPDTPDDVIHFEVRFAFIPRRSTNDVMYPLRRGPAHRAWASQVVLAARFGSSFVGVDVPILVENMSVEVHARIQLKLMPAPPVIKIAQISLMKPPKVDFVLKPLKSLDIMDLPGLQSFINSMIDSISSEIAVTPNCITVNVDEIVNGAILAAQKPIGVLCIGIIGAKIPKTSEYMGTVDPFVTVVVNGIERAHTKELVDQQDPRWGETFWILLPNDKSQVTLQVVHAASLVTKELTLGEVKIDIETILKQAKESQDDGNSNFHFSGWAPYHALSGDPPIVKGELQYSIGFFPSLSWTAPEEDGTEFIDGAGVLNLTFHQAVELTPKKSTQTKTMNVYAEGAIVPSHIFESEKNKIRLDSFASIPSASYFRTHTKKKTNSPLWSQNIRTFIKDASSYSLWIQIKEEHDLTGPSLIGECVLPLSDNLLQRDTSQEDDWFALDKNTSGKLRITYIWDPIKSLEDAESLESEAVGGESGSSARVPSVGLAHVTILEAEHFSSAEPLGQNIYVKAFFGGPKGGSGGVEQILSTRSVSPGDTGGAPPRLVWLDGSWGFIKKMEGTIVFEIFEAGSQKLLKMAALPGGGKGADNLLGSTSIKLADILKDPSQFLNHWLILKSKNNNEFCRLRVELALWPIIDPEKPIKMPHHSIGILRVRLLRTSGYFDAQSILKPSNLVAGLKLLSSVNEDEYISAGAKGGSSKQPEWKESFEWIILDAEQSAISITLRCRSKKVKKELNISDLGKVQIDLKNIINTQTSSSKKNKKSEDPEMIWPFSTVDSKFFDSKETAGISMEITYKPLDIDYSSNEESKEGLNTLLSFVASEEIPGYMVLRVQSASKLVAVDSSGTSDPFSVVNINGVKIGKTSVIKKNLNPDWNERFVLPVRSLHYAILGLEVFDWNRIDSFVHIGTLSIPVLRMILEGQLKKKHHTSGDQPLVAMYRDVPPDAISDDMLAASSWPLSNASQGTISLQVAFVENTDEFNKLSEHLASSGGLMKSTKGFFKGMGSVFVGATTSVAAAPLLGGKFMAKKSLGLFTRPSKSKESKESVKFEDQKPIYDLNIKMKGIVFGSNVKSTAKKFYIKARREGGIVAKSKKEEIDAKDGNKISLFEDVPTTQFEVPVYEGHNEPIVFHTKYVKEENEQEEEEDEEGTSLGSRFVFSPKDVKFEEGKSSLSIWLQETEDMDSTTHSPISKEKRAEVSKTFAFEQLLQEGDMFAKFKSSVHIGENLLSSMKSSGNTYLSLIISKK